MHATSRYERARRASSARVSGGTRASSGRGAIGARVPSTSKRSAVSFGTLRSGASRSTALGYERELDGPPGRRVTCDRARGGVLQCPLRGWRRDDRRAAPHPASGLLDPLGDGHVARRHRAHVPVRDGRIRRARRGELAGRGARRVSRDARHARGHVGAAEGADPRPHAALQRPARRGRDQDLHRMTVFYAVSLGFAAGILSGMFGVGGGILFVPTLSLVVGLSHLSAEATSLAAIIPVVLIGAWQQDRYGNVRWRPAIVIGLTSAGGVAAGVALATWLSEGVLEKLFAGLLLVVAARLAWSARH